MAFTSAAYALKSTGGYHLFPAGKATFRNRPDPVIPSSSTGAPLRHDRQQDFDYRRRACGATSSAAYHDASQILAPGKQILIETHARRMRASLLEAVPSHPSSNLAARLRRRLAK